MRQIQVGTSGDATQLLELLQVEHGVDLVVPLLLSEFWVGACH
jgi:hypothetical protein